MRRGAGVAVALALAAAGCAPPAPPGRASPLGATRSAPASRVARAERTHEYPGPVPAAQRPRSASADPVAAVRAFAAAYINWTATTVTARLRALAALSVGQARAAMMLAAAQTARDYELHRSGVANHGTVEAVAPLAGHRLQFAVVTREQTTAAFSDAYRGLLPAWHVALATVTAVPGGGWALSAWQPEN